MFDKEPSDRDPKERDRVGEALDGIAGNTSRRGFIARLGAAMMAATAGSVVGRAIEPGEAGAYHFCGHIYTTGSCIHPTGTPRIDADGWPLNARTGHPVDNLGRRINGRGLPVDGRGEVLRDPDGRPLPPAPRSKVCDETARRYNIKAQIDGSWYRCCGGQVRKLVDCCSTSNRRINGDASLRGYCYGNRKVSPNQIGMPSVDGNRLVFAVAKSRVNRIVLMGIKSRKRKTVLASRNFALSNPSLLGKSILYVRGERGHDELRVKSAANRRSGRALLSRKRLWSTALSARRAYVTVLSGRKPRTDITSVRR